MTPAKIGTREVTLSNQDKELWPEDGYTKGDLVDYLLAVAPTLLRHTRDRPLVLTRYPDGIHGEWFYQKDVPAYAPPWLDTFEYRGEGRDIRFLLAHDPGDLAWIGNQAAIEIHPWSSRIGSIGFPDYAVFDLDPAPPATFAAVVGVARAVKMCLDHLGLRGYPKTSGATGLHIYVPVRAEYPYPTVAAFVRRIAEAIRDTMPEQVTLERSVKKRSGRVYIDYLQNAKGKTIVGPYVPRPFPGAPVSTPIGWDELDGVDPARFNIRSVPARIGSVGDLFEPVLVDEQSLDDALRSLGMANEVGGPRFGRRPPVRRFR
ncbi:MAG: non-homologous end-joining DNA ligase [Firmicutes bacterium]|jgi:bifunctional non-homologous end joining protein LigD|nr:non-homologous end-joining DNA ligase [Bacillota bacterium]